jgi:hypothetical protein
MAEDLECLPEAHIIRQYTPYHMPRPLLAMSNAFFR